VCVHSQIKKKKRSRNVKQNKAEYVVEGSRVHMRKIQGVVMVHVGADWISFARYAAAPSFHSSFSSPPSLLTLCFALSVQLRRGPLHEEQLKSFKKKF
jgi:hypothetical protein